MQNLQNVPGDSDFDEAVEITPEDAQIQPSDEERLRKKDRSVPAERDAVTPPIDNPDYAENTKNIEQNTSGINNKA